MSDKYCGGIFAWPVDDGSRVPIQDMIDVAVKCGESTVYHIDVGNFLVEGIIYAAVGAKDIDEVVDMVFDLSETKDYIIDVDEDEGIIRAEMNHDLRNWMIKPYNQAISRTL
jgi:hypothetical protein